MKNQCLDIGCCSKNSCNCGSRFGTGLWVQIVAVWKRMLKNVQDAIARGVKVTVVKTSKTSGPERF